MVYIAKRCLTSNAPGLANGVEKKRVVVRPKALLNKQKRRYHLNKKFLRAQTTNSCPFTRKDWLSDEEWDRTTIIVQELSCTGSDCFRGTDIEGFGLVKHVEGSKRLVMLGKEH